MPLCLHRAAAANVSNYPAEFACAGLFCSVPEGLDSLTAAQSLGANSHNHGKTQNPVWAFITKINCTVQRESERSRGQGWGHARDCSPSWERGGVLDTALCSQGCSRSVKHLVGFAAFERKTGWNGPAGFLIPALWHAVLLESTKQGTVCGRFLSHHLNPLPLGEGCVRRDLEERHGQQLEISGKL